MPVRQILFVPGLLGSRLRHYGPERQPLVWPMTELDPQTALARLALDVPEAAAVLADGLIEGEFDALLALLAEHADVVTPIAFDWRRSIDGAARSVLARLREDASEIVIVTHSMGGNVVRAMLAAASDRPVIRRISRIVALGAPWWGSAVSYHAAVYGRAPSFRLPQSIGDERLRRTLSTFTSLHQLMPSPTYWERFERAFPGRAPGAAGAPSAQGALRGAGAGEASDAALRRIELIEIVGTGTATVCDLEERPAEVDGDGIVPLFAAGYDAAAPHVRVEAAHHELPAHPAALEAVERAVKRGAGRGRRAFLPSAPRPSAPQPSASQASAPQDSAPQAYAAHSSHSGRMPIAIIGIGCRFPGGVRDLESFWRLLESGVDGIVDIPPERWDVRRFYDEDPERPGKMYVKQAGFLQQDVRSFDPMCFGISPREAESLDPQQMLLLETAWEAMEDAGIPAASLRGSDTGVFIGGFCLDNKLNNLSLLNRELLGPHSGTGATMAVLSNRLSYTFDLKGPSLSIDTACSSSLVAIHYACESIWRGECSLAFAGGVNVMLRPEYFIAMCKGHFLSHHARCKAFDADAAGYVRGEGAGVILLKPLERAIADGDPIHAVILSTGVNQDGQTPGLPVPNADAQEELIRQVCAKAGVRPAEVAYVEAHGTGTQAGDPREAKALHHALSEGRDRSRPCWVGSVKTNIGHLEAAAGVAGLIKAALVLKKGVVPPNLHFKTPNPAIPFDRYCIRVPTEAVPLSRESGPLMAGVNSFGYGGTNAHVLLQEPPAVEPAERAGVTGADAAGRGAAGSDQVGTATGPDAAAAPAGANAWRPGLPFIFPLSAHTEGSLRRRAALYAEWIEKERPQDPARLEAWLRDLLYSAARRRDHLPVRAAVVASDVDELVRALRGFADEGRAQGVVFAPRPEGEVRPAFIYTGMGPQWYAMGRELLNAFPGFRESVTRLDAAFREVAGWSILEEMEKDEASSRMGETWVAQPANFVLQVALTELLGEWGIRPEAITGHSVGEVTASYAGGALPLRDAVSVSYHRSRLQHTLAGRGGMLAVGCSLEEAEKRLEGRADACVAAVNSRTNVTLAGAQATLAQVAAELEREGLFARFLRVDIPYHSPVMEEIREPLLASLAAIAPQESGLNVYSTVTGDRTAGEAFGAAYWYRNVREPVRFEAALRSMLRDGYNLFVEVGPHPVLSAAIAETLRTADRPAVHIATLRRQEPEAARLLLALAEWYVRGLPVHWERIYPAGRWLALPHYPFERRRFDVQSVGNAQDLRGAAGSAHPWLTTRVPDPIPTWEVELRLPFIPYLHEHRVEGAIVFPAAGYIEAGLALAAAEAGLAACRLENVRFDQALIIDPKRLQDLRMRYFPQEGRFDVSSRLRGGEAEDTWSTHAGGTILAPFDEAEPPEVDVAAWREACTEAVDVAQLYERLERAGLAYGPAFRTIRSLWVGGRRNVARLERPAGVEADGPGSTGDGAAGRGELLSPVLLDGAFQSLFAIVAPGRGRLKPYVPYSVERITFYRTPGASCWVSAVMHGHDEQEIRADLLLADDAGRLLVEVKGLVCRALDGAAETGTVRAEIRYADVWRKVVRSDEAGEENEVDGAGGQAAAAGSESEAAVATARTEVWHWYSPDPAGDAGARLARAAGAPASMQVHRTLDSLLQGVSASLGADQGGGHAAGQGNAKVRVVWMTAPAAGEEQDWSERAAALSDEFTQLVRCLRPGPGAGADAMNGAGATAATHTAAPLVQIDLVTMGTQPVLSGADVVHPADAALWGVAAVAANEYEGLVIRRCDLPVHPEERDRRAWLNWLFDPSAPQECAVRQGAYWERALSPLAREQADGAAAAETLVPTTEPLELRIDRPGKIDDLYFRRVSRRPPGPGEIEILVHHAALNYKDLLKTLGQIAGEVIEGTYFGRDLGMESTGVVVAVGEGVTRFKPGDEVVASVSGFRTYATVPEVYAVRKPRNLAFAEAPVYLGYMTAYYGLVHVARLAPGESVLIHNATGGVGLAAVQIAQWVGAEIYATAGTEEKREFLRRLGVKHVYHSRSTRFVDEIRRDTGGRGVDVVLNAIAGEALDKSLGLLASFGRFIEIGKRDIGENRGLPMGAFDRNLTFAAVDLDRMMAERPDISNRLIWEITDHIEQGHFGPMPVTEFAAAEAHEAFRMMSQSRHIGKIVLRFAGERVPVRTGTGEAGAVVRRDGAYLVTGGTSGLGLEIGRHLALAGAGRVILASRRGMTPDCRRVLDELGPAAGRIEVRALDVTDPGQVRELVAGVRTAGLPLRGVFHCAMVLDDDNLSRLDLERFKRVIAPKVGGCQALIRALGLDAAGTGRAGAAGSADGTDRTGGTDSTGAGSREALDFFVTYSSISSIIGNPGQGNYVAANAVLDAAAHHLAAAGVRALTVNLGVLSEVGVASRNERLESVLEAAGIRGLSPREAVQGTFALLELSAVQAGLFDVDWSKWAAAYPVLAGTPRFRSLAGSFSESSGAAEHSWAQRLAGLGPEEREALLTGRIRELLGRILRLPPDAIPADAPISRLGMDSLMAIELRHLLKEEFGATFTTLELLRGPKVSELAASLLAAWKLADVVAEAV